VRGERRAKKCSYEQCMNSECVREAEADRSSTKGVLTRGLFRQKNHKGISLCFMEETLHRGLYYLVLNVRMCASIHPFIKSRKYHFINSLKNYKVQFPTLIYMRWAPSDNQMIGWLLVPGPLEAPS
jgi:hypothetical protein